MTYMIWQSNPVQCREFRWWLSLFQSCILEYYNAAFIQSTDQDLTGKVCAHQLERFVLRTVQLHWNVAAVLSCIPPCFISNECQSKAHFYSSADHQVYTCKAMQLKATYFWTGKYFAVPLSGRGKCFRKKKKSKQERAACTKESQACNQWLGRVSGQDDIPTAAWPPSLNCQTLMFVNWTPTLPERLPQQRSGWLEFSSGRHVAQERLKVDTTAHEQIKQPVCTVYCQGPETMIRALFFFKRGTFVAMQKHFLIPSIQ